MAPVHLGNRVAVRDHAAPGIIAAPDYIGFARNYGHGDRYVAELAPGESAHLRAGITGSELDA